MHYIPVFRILPHLLVLVHATNQPLETEDSVLRVDNSLALGRQADKTFGVFCESNHGRGCPRTLRVLNDTRRLALHDGDT